MFTLTFYFLPAISINDRSQGPFNQVLQIDESFAILETSKLGDIFSHCYANEKSRHVRNFVLSFLHEK